MIYKEGEFANDEFKDELNLVIKTENGLILIFGCAHNGILNIISSSKEYFEEEVFAVVGGSI